MRHELIPLPTDKRPYTLYEWETATAWRILLRFSDGDELDIEWDTVIGTCRRWDNGIERYGNPEWN